MPLLRQTGRQVMLRLAVLIGLIGIVCSAPVRGQQEADLSATGTDSQERAEAWTDADGQLMVESPEFPRGARFRLQDADGIPLKGIRLEYQGTSGDSLVVGRCSDPEGGMRKAIFLGVPAADGATPLTLSQVSPSAEIAGLLGEEVNILADEEALARANYPGPGRTIDADSLVALVEELLQGEGDQLVLTLGPTGARGTSLIIDQDKYAGLSSGADVLLDYVAGWDQSIAGVGSDQELLLWTVDWGVLLPGVGGGLQVAGDTALRFTREDRHEVQVGLVATTGDQYTVEAWIRATHRATGPNSEATIVGQHASVDDAKGTLDIANGKLRFLVNTNQGGHHDLRTEMDVPIGVWTHVAGVYDGQSMKLYIDAQERASKPLSGQIVSKNRRATLIGGYAGTSAVRCWFDGDIDEVRIWDVARTVEQLSEDMHRAIEPQAGLIGYWRFNDGAGSTARDDAGHEHRGVLTNYRTRGRPTWVPGVFGGSGEAGESPGD
jgi:hypothetical protein